jgi:hypothetical protein
MVPCARPSRSHRQGCALTGLDQRELSLDRLPPSQPVRCAGAQLKEGLLNCQLKNPIVQRFADRPKEDAIDPVLINSHIVSADGLATFPMVRAAQTEGSRLAGEPSDPASSFAFYLTNHLNPYFVDQQAFVDAMLTKFQAFEFREVIIMSKPPRQGLYCAITLTLDRGPTGLQRASDSSPL